MFVRTTTYTFAGGGRVTITKFGSDPDPLVAKCPPTERERRH